MRLQLNDQPITLIPGMTVRQALIQAGLFPEIEKGAEVIDEWGNRMGLDGAVEEGMKLEVRRPAARLRGEA
jgi:hypothetical protein